MTLICFQVTAHRHSARTYHYLIPACVTTDFLNIFLFRNSAAAVAGFLFISRPPAKLLKYFSETLASFRPACLPAPLTRNRARETHRAGGRGIKPTPHPGTFSSSAHARVDKARRDERHQNRCPRRRNPSRRALAPCSGLRPSGVVSGARPHPACLPAARRCAPEFQKNTRSFSALPSALS